ncbi:CpaE family protein [Microbacterium sp. NIBRBAC000506063]|uniref:AAA family ATPase n=1 Tax=Microbacterium sp. NIBRBAC000506063 TaxID=2734618 RepID=UPI001BB797AF|nr:hypothetical protein [Microbacterium sp. NIBRBAC000506063]QTV79420.1 hypothetical protein KAE78_10830 [Microbacterium sp. NIBRBAC000506063]
MRSGARARDHGRRRRCALPDPPRTARAAAADRERRRDPRCAVAACADRCRPSPLARHRGLGPHGAPGRSTVAIQLAAELARGTRHVALVDADTHAPSLALLLAQGDDSPGIAAACRRAELGGLDADELARLATPILLEEGGIDVLGGLNRPSRWPELSAHRLRTALEVCRGWADDTIVDVAAPLESDEEVSFDLEAPRRNAATLTALREADAIVAVASAEPLGIARFLHGHAELRALVGATPITVVVNRVRSGPMGIDARGQIRRTLERFAGIRDVQFLPDDRRAADAALLHSRPMIDVTPRAPVVAAMRSLAAALPAGAASDDPEPAPRRRLFARR